jgi:hypothetical protein
MRARLSGAGRHSSIIPTTIGLGARGPAVTEPTFSVLFHLRVPLHLSGTESRPGLQTRSGRRHLDARNCATTWRGSARNIRPARGFRRSGQARSEGGTRRSD